MNMFVSTLAAKDIEIGPVDSLLVAVMGFIIVFAVLLLLMFIIWAMGEIFKRTPAMNEKFQATSFGKAVAGLPEKIKSIGKKKDAGQVTAEAVSEAEPKVLAKGTCGELKLIKTSERDAAMIMAIVADATETPLNELRFKSIKYLGEGEEK